MRKSQGAEFRRAAARISDLRRVIAASLLACFLALGWRPAHSAVATAEGDICAGIDGRLPLPSSMLVRDYERILFKWLYCRQYAKAGWSADKAVRDTGPFIDGMNYGTHPAVKMYYSPEIIEWTKAERNDPIPDGAVIVKEMYSPPAAIYEEMYRGLERKYPGEPARQKSAFDELLKPLLSAWTVMVRDKSGSKDGWFWAGPGNAATLEDLYKNNLTTNYANPVSATFGEYGCLRCHSSAATGFTFSSQKNIAGFPGTPLRFRVDESWRSRNYLTKLANWEAIRQAAKTAGIAAQFALRLQEVPWLEQIKASISEHGPQPRVAAAARAPAESNAALIEAYQSTGLGPPTPAKAFPPEYADHAIPGPDGPGGQPERTNTSRYEHITSDTCIGCHGGLGGAPSGVTMFLQTGSNYGEGYNVSEYGEWRWSPMGLAGRDPIFHAQIESEMILLRRDSLERPSSLKGPLAATQQAVIDTCLSCHGAMGQRQLQIDAGEKRTLPGGGALNAHFNLDYFDLVRRLGKDDPVPEAPKGGLNPPIAYGKGEFYQYHRYGALAREGVSCVICHRIAGPTKPEVTQWKKGVAPGWLGTNTSPGVGAMAFQFMNNSTGRYRRNNADELYGPFAKVAVKPMEHALGITPIVAPAAYGAPVPPGSGHPVPFTQDSRMCGSCHTINLPNIGQQVIAGNVLNAATPNPAFADYNHSIEQATFAEWQNSDFGPGLDNRPKVTFKSCQDCHMPGGFSSLEGSIKIKQLVTEIATIQDTTYPEAEHELPPQEIEVPQRADYRRHELVGLNVFMLEMARQFPQIIGVSLKDNVMTYADNGSQLAIDNMVRQAREATVALTIERASIQGNQLDATVAVENLTGHRFPSGVAFRRAFLEFQVLENGKPIWVSGRTNAAGLIVGEDGRTPLKTEFLNQFSDGNRFADYQPHYQKITAPDQVQIYETLELDADPQSGRTFPGTPGDKLPQFTTSFIHRVNDVKDNRLLPKGWVPSSQFKSQGEIMRAFMKATDPEGKSVTGGQPKIGARPMPNGALEDGMYLPDPNYVATDIGTDRLDYAVTLPPGVDTSKLSIKVTMHFQAFTPAWLHQRFSQAASAKSQGLPTPAADRLYHLVTNLNVTGTAIEDWKLPLVSIERPVPVHRD